MDSNVEFASKDYDTCKTEVAPGVFIVYGQINVVDDEGVWPVKGDALYLYMELSTAERILSKEAINAGEIEDGRLSYTAPFRTTIPMYELLSRHYITDYDIIRKYDIDEEYRSGQYFCSDYFGEFNEAVPCRDAAPVRSKRVTNGVYVFLYTDGGVEIAIHETVAHYELSDIAETIGEKHGDYFHFQNETCAIPIYELAEVYPDLEEVLVDDRDELLRLLSGNFSAYLLAIGDRIPHCEGDD